MKPTLKVDLLSQGNSHAGSSDMVEVIPGREKLHMVEFSFEAQSAGELSVTEGNLVSVLRYSDTSGNPEWWLIQCNGATGYVPQSYLSPLEDAADSSEGGASITDNAFADVGDISHETSQMEATETDPREECSVALTGETNPKSSYYAEFAFEASSAAELNLEEGQAVVVLQKQDLTGNEEWWLVEADRRKGIRTFQLFNTGRRLKATGKQIKVWCPIASSHASLGKQSIFRDATTNFSGAK